MRKLSYVLLFAGLVGLAVLTARPSPAADAKGDWVTIKGQVVFAGDPPKQQPLNVNKDQAHCLSKGPVLSEEWVVNPSDKGIKNVFVWITSESGGKPQINPQLAQIKDKTVKLDQPVCAFVPHAIALRQGQTLLVHNSAPIAHNVNWSGSRAKNPGSNVIVAPNSNHEISNLKADRYPISVSCNIHGWMKAWIWVFDHPYYAVTDGDGKFEIKLAPAGKVKVFYWHDTGYKDGAAGAKGFPITLKPGQDNDLGKIEWKK
jgi:hypothetical protein